MRLLLYYAGHAFVNQIRKLFKTWVAVFIGVCLLFGLVVGGGFSFIGSLAEKNAQPEPEPGVEEPAEEPDDIPDPEIHVSFSLEGIETAVLVEAAAGLVMLLVFVFEIYQSGKSGSAIFTMADVNLLFPAPMKPQSVLMFKLITRMGATLAATFYMAFQIPNLILNAGLPAGAAWLLLVVWFLLLAFGRLLSVLLYTVSNTRARLKRLVKPLALGILALAAVGFVLRFRASSAGALRTAVEYFASPALRYVPIWGWLKAIVFYMTRGDVTACLPYAAALVVTGAALIFIIWRIRADFYEECLASSEERAEKLAAVQEKSGMVTRKKERGDKLRRDGFHRGQGASVYFHMAMYNRFRFAKLKYFTTTCILYTALSAVACVLILKLSGAKGVEWIVVMLGVAVFFRALGDPIARDTQQSTFTLVPDSAFRKIAFSLLGGVANCAMDILPGLILGCIVLRGDPLKMALWLVLIVSLDLYSSSVGAFIAMSLPVSLANNIRSVVQIMFVYFGLIPFAAIVATGLILKQFLLFSVIAVAFNVAISALFVFWSSRIMLRGRK